MPHHAGLSATGLHFLAVGGTRFLHFQHAFVRTASGDHRGLHRLAHRMELVVTGDLLDDLVGVLLEQHEEWQYGERRYLSQTSLQRLTDMLHTDNSTGGAGSHPAPPAITT